MKAAIITIGDELLIGQTVDTNSAWIGAELSKSGFDVYRITSIHDKKEDILNALNESAGKSRCCAYNRRTRSDKRRYYKTDIM